MKEYFYLLHDLGGKKISEKYDWSDNSTTIITENSWYKTAIEIEPKDEKFGTKIIHPCECISCKEIVEVNVSQIVTAYIPKETLEKIYNEDNPIAKRIKNDLFTFSKIDEAPFLGMFLILGIIVLYVEIRDFSNWIEFLSPTRIIIYISSILFPLFPFFYNITLKRYIRKHIFPKKFRKYNALVNVKLETHEYLMKYKDVSFIRYIRSASIKESSIHLLSKDGNLNDRYNNNKKNTRFLFFNQHRVEGFTSKPLSYYE